MPQSESQWQTIGHCKICGSAIKEMEDKRLYTGPRDCNCELQRLKPKEALLKAIETALAFGRSPISPNMMRLLNEQLGKIKSLANDIEEEDDERKNK